ncbi:MAG: HTTM domain-containing protein [Rhodospirillaceae bacterium]|nr:HTTM domain-containing protein [Rhodospirillaceae bacterium]
MTQPAGRAGDAMTGALGRIRTLAARPVCGQSLAVFRIAFGLLMLNDVVHLLRYDWLTGFYIDRAILFPYYGLEVPALPAPWLHLLWSLCGLCCVMVTLGAFYRIAIWGFNAIFIYFFLLDQLLYLNHFYMIALFGLLLGCTDAHRCWSLDRRLGRIGSTTKVPLWNLLILQFQVEVILVFAGLVKIEVDWLRGEPLRTWMLERPWSPLSTLFEVHWITLAAPVLIILLHTVGAPLLLWSKTRLWVFLLYCAFHATNAHLFNIGVFPWMTIAATTIMFSPAWPTILAGRIGAALTWLRLPRPPVPAWIGQAARFVGGGPTARGGERAAFRPLHPAALAALVLYALVQIWLPVRDTLFEGYVGWTEEGQKFSWRMMLYVHGADGRLIAVTPEDEAWVIDMQAHLDPLQTWMVFAKPEMLLHFVHLMKAHYAETGVGDVRIYADVVKNVNGQPYRRLIDPDVDLAAVDGINWFGEDPWVLRPARMQAAEGLAPDWYPPITAARFGAMLDALGAPDLASEAEAAPARGVKE